MNINFLPKLYRKNYQSLVRSKNSVTAFVIIVGIIALSLIQAKPTSNSSNQTTTPGIQSSSQAKKDADQGQIAEVIYGPNADPTEIENMLRKQIKFITTRPAFIPSLRVVQKHEDTIRAQAQALGVPQDVAIGVAFLENGGSETARSVAGAVGIYQLMPGTAQNLGLSPAERTNPQKNIEAGLRYLSNNYRRFNDWGLSIWAYHAGEGNVCRAIKTYAQSLGENLSSCLDNPQTTHAFVKRHNLTVHKLLSNPAVQTNVTSKLNDDSSGYPYKVMTMAHLFKLASTLDENSFMNRINLLNTHSLSIKEFLNVQG